MGIQLVFELDSQIFSIKVNMVCWAIVLFFLCLVNAGFCGYPWTLLEMKCFIFETN